LPAEKERVATSGKCEYVDFLLQEEKIGKCYLFFCARFHQQSIMKTTFPRVKVDSCTTGMERA
jgi:hypothetical protein